jgi:hypothetical protein
MRANVFRHDSLHRGRLQAHKLAPEATLYVSPIEGEGSPATDEVALTAQYNDTKADVTPLYHHPQHPSDVLSAEEGPENCHKHDVIEYDAADAGGAADAKPPPRTDSGQLHRSKNASESEMGIDERHTDAPQIVQATPGERLRGVPRVFDNVVPRGEEEQTRRERVGEVRERRGKERKESRVVRKGERGSNRISEQRRRGRNEGGGGSEGNLGGRQSEGRRRRSRRQGAGHGGRGEARRGRGADKTGCAAVLERVGRRGRRGGGGGE